MLGGDEDDAVRALRSIDGRGRGVLEDLHTDDIGRVDGGEGRDGGYLSVAEAAETEVTAGIAAALDDDTVDDIQRLRIGVDRSLAADADGRGRTGGSGSLHCRDTGGAALEGLVEVGDDGALEVRLLHRDGSAGEVAAFHRTVADDDDFVQELSVFSQRDRERGLVADFNLLGSITDGRDLQHCSALDGEFEITVQAGSGTVGGTFLDDACPDDRSYVVDDGSGDTDRLRHCGQAKQQHHQRSENSAFHFGDCWLLNWLYKLYYFNIYCRK